MNCINFMNYTNYMNHDIDLEKTAIGFSEAEKKELQVKLEKIKRNIAALRRKHSDYPPGKIYCKKCGKYYRFYIRYDQKESVMIGGDNNSLRAGQEKYVEKKNEIVPVLAEKVFYEQLIACVEKRVRRLEDFLEDNKSLRDEARELLPEPIRNLLPAMHEEEDFVISWKKQAVNAETLNIYPEEKVYTAVDGTRTRSKAEVIIANELNRRGIPYVYEKILKLSDGNFVSPDFTMPDALGEREIILEHFGKMGESGYCEKALRKINLYQKNGYLLGDNFFALFESVNVTLDTANMMSLLDYISTRFNMCA